MFYILRAHVTCQISLCWYSNIWCFKFLLHLLENSTFDIYTYIFFVCLFVFCIRDLLLGFFLFTNFIHKFKNIFVISQIISGWEYIKISESLFLSAFTHNRWCLKYAIIKGCYKNLNISLTCYCHHCQTISDKHPHFIFICNAPWPGKLF